MTICHAADHDGSGDVGFLHRTSSLPSGVVADRVSKSREYRPRLVRIAVVPLHGPRRFWNDRVRSLIGMFLLGVAALCAVFAILTWLGESELDLIGFVDASVVGGAVGALLVCVATGTARLLRWVFRRTRVGRRASAEVGMPSRSWSANTTLEGRDR
jgi:uncharacterized membrane protein YedE/YeeE